MGIRERLSKSRLAFTVYATAVTFVLYSCCYAYRKPFTTGLYEGATLWGGDLKTLLILSEIIGYAVSKLIGTYILPSVRKEWRIGCIIGLLSFSELAWLGFAVLPEPLKLCCALLSGLPLGMIWGLVFSYVEGRRVTELINVGISVAVIVASGLVKTLAQTLMDEFSVPEYWMPFATGAVVFPVMLLSCYLLDRIPEPTENDKMQRSERLPMHHAEKKSFVRQFFPGICLLFLLFGSLTVFRELRDSFAANVWAENGVTDPWVFTTTEYPIAFVVLALMCLTVFIPDNKKAINYMYVIAVIGAFLTLGATAAFMARLIGPVLWMTLIGVGLYMGYTIYTYLIDRLIAALHVTSTAVFFVYLIDSFGYLGTAGVFVFKNFSDLQLSWSATITYVALISSFISLMAVAGSFFYFGREIRRRDRVAVRNG